MKRLLLSLLTFVFLIPFTGCGNTPPPADNSNQPSEVQEYENRKKLEREKKAGTAGAPGGGIGGGVSAPR